MKSRRLVASFILLACAAAARAAIPTPEEFFGFRMGTDRKLARYDKIAEYFRKIAAESGRVRCRNLGPTTQGNPFVMLEISSEANIAQLEKLKALERKLYFIADGGTLVALGEATDLLVSKLPLGVKDLKRSATREQHFAPGTIVNVQVDTTHPLGWGAAAGMYGFYSNSPFFQLVEGFSSHRVTVAARYPNADVRASGWLRGEELMSGRAAVVTVEMNPVRIVLFGLRPQHRAQTHATLPLLFNALYWPVEGDAAAVKGQ